MNNIRLWHIMCIIFAAVLVGTAYVAISATLSNKALSQELAARTAELENTKSALADTRSMLIDTTAALDNEKTEAETLLADLNTVQAELTYANSIIEAFDGEKYIVDLAVSEQEIDMLAKTVWGEARGCDRLGQSAVVWCILNRVDSGRGTIAQVITEHDQFHGYSPNYPVTPEIRELVQDVVTRWLIEKYTCGDVGRTLPSNYMYFRSDETGIGNIFRTEWTGDFEVWNWNCWNPYK